MATTVSMQHHSESDQQAAYSFSPIGYLESCFKTKNGTPRQPSVCSFARARLKILKSVFQSPDHSLEGLQDFSHVWIIYVFHQNNNQSFTKAKVKPPRLDGRKTGVFACRSPYRPNPIGMTLARLEKIKGDTLHLSGVDIIHGTPVLDIKPFIPSYDHVTSAILGIHETTEEIPVEHVHCVDNAQTVGNSETVNAKIHSHDTVTCKARSLPDGDAVSREEHLDMGAVGNATSGSGSNSAIGQCEVPPEISQSVKAAIYGRDDLESSVGFNSTAPTKDTQGNNEGTNSGSISHSPENVLKDTAKNMTVSSQLGASESIRTSCDDKVNSQSKRCDANDDGSNLGRLSESPVEAVEAGQQGCNCPSGLLEDEVLDDGVRVGDWVSSPPTNKLQVRFTQSALEDLQKFREVPSEGTSPDPFHLEFFRSQEELKEAIISILAADPRSTYRRSSCSDRLYYFPLDSVHITSWFPRGCAEVLRIQPISWADIPTKK